MKAVIELARHLGLSDRRIRQLEREQVIERLDNEPARYDLDECAGRYRLYDRGDIEAVCQEIQRAAEILQDLLDEMATVPMDKREPLAGQVGPAMKCD
jgi:hypothetical protein